MCSVDTSDWMSSPARAVGDANGVKPIADKMSLYLPAPGPDGFSGRSACNGCKPWLGAISRAPDATRGCPNPANGGFDTEPQSCVRCAPPVEMNLPCGPRG